MCASLPKALRELGLEVKVLLPGYAGVLRGTHPSEGAPFAVLGHEVRLFEFLQVAAAAV